MMRLNDLNRRYLLIRGAGTAIAWPAAARAQEKAMSVIGYLAFGTPDSAAPLVAALR
jgi:hypothetical protein